MPGFVLLTTGDIGKAVRGAVRRIMHRAVMFGAIMTASLTTTLGAQSPPPVEAVVTTADRTRLLATLPVSRAPDTTAWTVEVDTMLRYQSMTGFGAALTDASVSLLNALPRAARDALVRELFSPTRGVGFSMLRIPIGASDFSTSHTTLADSASYATDGTPMRLNLLGESARLALLRDIRRQQPALTVMATPWSAPAWMKTPASLYGGTLRDDAMPHFAHYLARVVAAFDSAGVPIDLLSVQNEPQHAPPDYPGMRLSPAQRATLVGRHLGPALARLPHAPQLLEWDHNWDAPEEPLAVLADSAARGYVHGVAWHCYAGDVSAQSRVQAAFPSMATYFTECAGGAWAPDFGDNLLWNSKTLIVGATRHWARGVMLWNVALDATGGPHKGGCANCRGVVTIDARTARVTRNEEYYALAHASRFVARGAVRVESRLTGATAAEAAGVTHVAFVHPDGAVTVIVVNEHRRAVRLTVARATVTAPPRSVVTVVVRAQ
ncbi:glycoside hydrolase family 30 protein [Gemmatimonas sp.]